MNKQYKKVKDDVFTAEDNFVDEVSEFFIAVSKREDGKFGLVAEIDLSKYPIIEKPLIGATKQDLEAILKVAKEAAQRSGGCIKIIRFSKCEIFKEFHHNEKI